MTEKPKDLQVAAPTPLATPASNVAGFEHMSPDDLVIPRLRLLQGLSEAVTDERGKPGDWELTVADQIFTSPLTIIPLSVRNGAVLLEQGKGLVCRSNDGLKNMSGTPCSQCPYDSYYKEWVDGVAPKCAATKDFLDTLAKVLLRCWLMGTLLLLFSFVVFMLTGDMIDEIHGKMFGLTPHELDLIIYCWMGLFKLFVFIFFLIPWLAIKLVLRKEKG